MGGSSSSEEDDSTEMSPKYQERIHYHMSKKDRAALHIYSEEDNTTASYLQYTSVYQALPYVKGDPSKVVGVQAKMMTSSTPNTLAHATFINKDDKLVGVR